MNKILFRLPNDGIEEIYIGHLVLDNYNKLLKSQKYDKVITIIDKNAYKYYKDVITESLLKDFDKSIIFVNAKPHYKNYKHASHLIKKLIKFKANRKTCLLAIGGGYVSDITGFVSSIYMRGIDFIQVPTTFMSMTDPVIGKVAVNYNNYKNLVGSFHSPKMVFIDTIFLNKLPQKEIINGLVEVWKHALLQQHSQMVSQVNNFFKNKTLNDINSIIEFSINAKKSFVQNDYYDINGSHKALSLGHTLANYLERNMQIRHGEAVFYGIMFSAILSFDNKLIDKDSFNLIKKTGRSFEKYFKQFDKVKKMILNERFLDELKLDKINYTNHYSFVLLNNNGFIIKNDLGKKSLQKLIEHFCSLTL